MRAESFYITEFSDSASYNHLAVGLVDKRNLESKRLLLVWLSSRLSTFMSLPTLSMPLSRAPLNVRATHSTVRPCPPPMRISTYRWLPSPERRAETCAPVALDLHPEH